MFVYDITNEESVNQIEQLKRRIESIRKSRSFCMVIVGNKSDLEHCREVKREKAEHIASKLSAACHVDCSACGPETDVRNVFDELCRQVASLRQQSAQKRERRRSSLSQVGRGLKMLVQTGKSKNHVASTSSSESGATSPVSNGRQITNNSVLKKGKFSSSSSYTSLVSAPILNGLPEEQNPFFSSFADDTYDRKSRKSPESCIEIREDSKRSTSNYPKTGLSAFVL